MDTLLAIDSSGQMSTLNVDLGVYSIGKASHNDLVVSFDSDEEISVVKNERECYLQLNSGRLFGGKKTKKLISKEVFTLKDIVFVYIPKISLSSDEVKDWDISKFPNDTKHKNYPQHLLDFILHIIDADQGAILLLKEGQLRSLAAKDITLRDQSELFLQRILESKDSDNVINMSYNTHTLLFQAGLTPLDFCLIQSSISENERVVLYIPRTSSMNEVPQGLMTIMLNLFAGNLVNHLLFMKHLEQIESSENFEHNFFWGNSEVMISLKYFVDRLTKTNLSILIQGETGCGKEQLVKYIKEKSDIKKIVSVNCATISKDLAESTLFGHKKGSFTGAHEDQVGKIEQAHDGILFLDEVGELDIEVQAKLLRVLQENKICPIGGDDKEVNTWVICATHKNLKKMIAEGKFREDLYFRINEANVKIPSLAQRPEDIRPLSSFLFNQVLKDNRISEKFLSDEVLNHLSNRSWPGNIRELKSYIRKLVLLTEQSEVRLSDLQLLGMNSSEDLSQFPDDLQEAKKQFVEAHVEKILKKCNGNKTHAAKLMGITPRNLYRLIPSNSENNDVVL